MDLNKIELAESFPKMDMDEYQRLAMRTKKELPTTQDDLVHAALGACSDAGEFATAVKAYVIYNKPLDGENLREEIGDILWFLALAAEALETPLSECAHCNIEKLRKRYPDKYSDQAAQARADKA